MTESDFLQPEQIIQLGRAPNRIDLLTSISGVDSKEAFATKVMADRLREKAHEEYQAGECTEWPPREIPRSS